jgi:hypothetical protein
MTVVTDQHVSTRKLKTNKNKNKNKKTFLRSKKRNKKHYEVNERPQIKKYRDLSKLGRNTLQNI